MWSRPPGWSYPPRRRVPRVSASAGACAAGCGTCARRGSSPTATSGGWCSRCSARASAATSWWQRSWARWRLRHGAARAGERARRAPTHHGAARGGHRRVPAVRRDPRQRRPLLPDVRHADGPPGRASDRGSSRGRARRSRGHARRAPTARRGLGGRRVRRHPRELPLSAAPAIAPAPPAPAPAPPLQRQPTGAGTPRHRLRRARRPRAPAPLTAPRRARTVPRRSSARRTGQRERRDASTARSPPPGAGSQERCPLCGGPLGAEQEWCLRCGAAARTRLAATPRWRPPVIALASVIVLSLGALTAALVSLAGSSGRAAPSQWTRPCGHRSDARRPAQPRGRRAPQPACPGRAHGDDGRSQHHGRAGDHDAEQGATTTPARRARRRSGKATSGATTGNSPGSRRDGA